MGEERGRKEKDICCAARSLRPWWYDHGAKSSCTGSKGPSTVLSCNAHSVLPK